MFRTLILNFTIAFAPFASATSLARCGGALSANTNLMNLLNKGIEMQVIKRADLQKMSVELKNPLKPVVGRPDNLALRDALEDALARIQPDQVTAVQSSIKDLGVTLETANVKNEVAKQKTTAIVAGEIYFETEPYQQENSELFWHRTEDGRDWVVSLRGMDLDLSVYDIKKGKKPVFHKNLLSEINSSGHPKTILSSESGHFYVAYVNAKENRVSLLDLSGNSSEILSAPLKANRRIFINETKAGMILVTSVGDREVEVFEKSDKRLTLISQFNTMLNPASSMVFENEKSELTLFSQNALDRHKFHLFHPLKTNIPVRTWNVKPPIGEFTPFVTKSGKFHLAVGTLSQSKTGQGIYFFNCDSDEGQHLEKFNHQSFGNWFEKRDGILTYTINGQLDSDPVKHKVTEFQIDGKSPPLLKSIPVDWYAMDLRWVKHADGRDLLFMYFANGLFIADGADFEAPLVEVTNKNLFSAQPGVFSMPTEFFLLSGSVRDRFEILQIPSGVAIYEGPNSPNLTFTPWHSMANGDLVTAATTYDFRGQKLQVYRLVNVNHVP